MRLEKEKQAEKKKLDEKEAIKMKLEQERVKREQVYQRLIAPPPKPK